MTGRELINWLLEGKYDLDREIRVEVEWTEARTDGKIAVLEKKAADAESNYNATLKAWENVSGELHNARAENEKLTARIERMKIEIDHYRSLPAQIATAQIATNEPVEWVKMREQMRKSMEASKAILDAAIKVMENV